MKFTVLLLILAASQAANIPEASRSREKTEEVSKTEKRALAEGNAGIQKRNPEISTAGSVAPGIQYADTKALQQDKSPQQQIYATPVPQLAKISDVLTGQGPPFQAAIASHLFSPISVYQPRLASYEVSAPVPSQLAYSEKVTYQPTTEFPTKELQDSNPPPSPQPIRIPQQIHLNHLNQVAPPPHQIPVYNTGHVFSQGQFQRQESNPDSFLLKFQPSFYHPSHHQPTFHHQSEALPYVQQQPIPIPNVIPGIVYAKEEAKEVSQKQKELKPQPTSEPQIVNKPGQVSYTTQSENAVSYASFSVGSTAPQGSQPHQQNVNPQPQYQLLKQQYQTRAPPHLQYQLQLQNHQQQNQQQQYNQIQQFNQQQQYNQQQQVNQPQQYNHPQQYQHQQYNQQQYNQLQQQQQPPILHQIQTQYHRIQASPVLPSFLPQQQVDIQPQVIHKLEQPPTNSVSIQTKPRLLYSAESVNQPQIFPRQVFIGQQPFTNHNPLLTPNYQPVQFYGKFAPEIFKHYQH